MGRIWKFRSNIGRHLQTGARKSSTAPVFTLSDCLSGGDQSKTETKSPKPYNQIPGPRPLPILGNSWRFLPFIGQYSLGELDRAMVDLHTRYGRMARLGGLIGHPDLLFVYDADLVEQVFRAEDSPQSHPCRPPMPSLAHYKRELRADCFGDSPGVIGIHGPLWHSFRTQVNKVMLTANAAKNFTADLDAVASDFVSRMHAIRDDNHELPHDFLDELYKWSLESLGVAALGTRLGCLQSCGAGSASTHRLLSAVRAFFDTVAVVELRKPYSRLLNTKDWRRYVAALDVFREECMRRVAEVDVGGRGGGRPASLLRQVLERTEDPRVAAVLAMDLMLVGLDTSSVSTATSLYLLARNPEAQERLFAELRHLMPHPDSTLHVEATEQMHYLRACVREALRIYPVIIGNGRCLSRDMVIGDYLVPKGVHVIFGHLVTGNDRDHGFPEPQRFAPERWLHGRTGGLGPGHEPHHDGSTRASSTVSSECWTRPHPFGAVPFGFGRRMCLGRRLAEHQLLLLLARVVRRYRVEYHHGDFEYAVTPVYAPKNALRFRLLEREETS